MELYVINISTLKRPMQSKGHITSLVLENKLTLMQFTYALFLECPQHNADISSFLIKSLSSCTATTPCILYSYLLLLLVPWIKLYLKFLIHLFPAPIHCHSLYTLDSKSVDQPVHYFQLHVISNFTINFLFSTTHPVNSTVYTNKAT